MEKMGQYVFANKALVGSIFTSKKMLGSSVRDIVFKPFLGQHDLSNLKQKAVSKLEWKASHRFYFSNYLVTFLESGEAQSSHRNL